jgi:hypothetical protein
MAAVSKERLEMVELSPDRRARPALRRIAVGCALLASAVLAGCAGAAGVSKPVQVEILVRGSDDFRSHYDYVTWAPAPALVRIVPSPGADPNATISVVLTNGGPAEDGKGHVNFASDAASYRQALDEGRAGLDQIALTLPADGAPVRIVVAGDFPHFSGRDKDTVIVAHAGGPSGPELGRATLMVRVRRNEETLTPEERDRFLWALATLRFRRPADEQLATYDFLVHMHDVAGRGFPDDYPDQAHKSAGFLAWHRAYLLEIERDLQAIDPSVALPYWPMYLTPGGRPAVVFNASFGGENSTASDPKLYVPEMPRFAFGNPLYGWRMGGLGPVMRWTQDRTKVGNFNKPGDLINDTGKPFRTQYAFLGGSVESNPHNIGHGWSGVWMSNCLISPGDPMFWMFHTYFDWLWASWQQHYDRFDKSGRDPADYSPNDHYVESDPASNQIPLGHHLLDTMWPWNEEVQPEPAGAFNSRRPPVRVGGPFPPAPGAGLWPGSPGKPMPADMIDYAGYESPPDDLGVGYDSIPWSPKQAQPPFPSQSELSAAALGIFLDDKRPDAARLARVSAIDLAEAAEPARVAAIEAVAKSARSRPALKEAALALLERIDTTAALETVARIDRDRADPALRQRIDEIRQLQMFATHSIVGKPAVTVPPRAVAATGLNPKLYALGQNNAPDNSEAMVATMTAELDKFLAHPDRTVEILPQDAVAFIVATDLFAGTPNPGRRMAAMAEAEPVFSADATRTTMRKILRTAPGRAVDGVDWWRTKALAAMVLAKDADPATAGLIRSVILDPRASVPARAIALNALRQQPGETFETAAFGLAGDPAAPAELRAHAIAAIGALVMDRGVDQSAVDLARFSAKLAALPTADLPPEAVAARQTTERLIALAAG